MKKNLIVLWFSILCVTSFGADYPTTSILKRVIALRCGNSQGTGFTVEVENRQYVVTAKHLVTGTNQTAEIDVYRGAAWNKMVMTVLRSAEADVAVLIPPQVLTTAPSVNLVSGSILGQDVYFLGFPYMMFSDVPASLNDNYPIPFVKKGIISAYYRGNTKYPTIFVDGINNPGFSGGPLVSSHGTNLDVLGIVIGYKVSSDRVVNNALDTGLTSLANSGIIECFDIRYAIDEIQNHPNGPKVGP